MQGHVDEVEYLKNENEEEEEEKGDSKEQIFKLIKSRTFALFFKLNTLKVSIPIHYQMIMIAIEGLQFLTLVLVDGSYSSLGPYETSSPWNLDQTQWLIDVCWVFRIDRYFRKDLGSFLAILSVFFFLILSEIGLGMTIAWNIKNHSGLFGFLTKVLKALIALCTNLLFIPIMDSFAFGMKCSLTTSDNCLGLPEGYQYLALYLVGVAVFLGVTALTSLLCYDFCMVCGGTTAKPHPRFKVLRLGSFVAVIFSYYFINTGGKVILFLLISMVVGVVLCYVYSQYIPYFNSKICNVRLGALVTFTSATFCMLIGEFFKNTDQTNSSVTMLYYFLTPCLIQIMQLAQVKRGRVLAERKVQQLTNIYQVEIKARMLVYKLEEAKNKNTKSIYSENDEGNNQELMELQTRTLEEIETTFQEAFKKFPNGEWLLLWSGQLQLHIFENYILAMVQCYKGLLISNKIDSQYALYHFRRTSESFYKAHMKDDAYEYELFEKARQTSQKNDEAVTRSQFYFWAELESRHPKIQKLNKLAGETSKLISTTKNNYQRLLKLNSKNSEALRMYGAFLSSLNNFAEMGQRYLNKAEVQDEAQKKSINSNVMSALSQPLSFFDNDNAIIQVSADFETMGEILKANSTACRLLSYISAELVGRNISLIIPPPFNENHDEYMKKLHENGRYSIVDNQGLLLYFADKNGHVFEGRLLVKVVPNDGDPPFLSAIIKPTKPEYEVIILNKEFQITGTSKSAAELFELSGNKTLEQKIFSIFPKFDQMKSQMETEEGLEHNFENDRFSLKLKLRLYLLEVGEESAHILRIETIEKREKNMQGISFGADSYAKAGQEEIRPVSSIQESNHEDVNLELESESSSILEEDKQGTEQESSDQESEEASEEASEEESEEESEEAKDDSGSQSGIAKEFDSLNRQKSSVGATGSKQSSKAKSSEESSKAKSSQGDSKAESSNKTEEEEELIGDFEVESGQEDSESEESERSKQSSSESEKSEEASYEEDDEEDNEEAQSAMNSSKSANSSMASLAQFNKSIKALVSYEFNKTKRYVMRFKITLILTIVLLIITSVLTFEVIDASVSFNEQLSHYVNLVGNLRLYSQSLAYYVRMITLMDTGLIPNSDRGTYIDWITEDSTDMHDINLLLYKNYDLLNSEDKAVYVDENIATWLLEGGKVREAKTNLFDATSNFILQGFLLKEEYKDKPVTLSNRRAFYLFRNGNGETLEYMNTSAEFYVTTAIQDLQNQRFTALALISASVVLLLFCAGFAIIPSIRTIEKSRREAWEIFFEIPGYVCRFMKAKCSDRLNILNEAQLELEEQIDEANHEEEKEAKNTQQTDAKKKNKKNSNKKVLAYDPRQRKIMTAKLLCFFVISIVYFYLIYYTGFEAVGQVLEEEPVHINWASRRRQLSRGINMWVTEALFENVTDVGWKYVVPSGQNIGSPYRKAQKLVNELDFVENSLIFGAEEHGIAFSEMRSQEHDDILFENACNVEVSRSKPDCDTVGDKAMMQGLHSALGMYTTLARSLLMQIQNSYGNFTESDIIAFFNSEDMKLLRDMDSHYLYDPLTESSKLYEEDYAAHQDQMKVWQNVLMILYCLFSLLFFFFVYSPMINKIGMDTKNAWSMCTLIPQEYQEDFKKLTNAIRDRRDNFKWR